MAAKPTDSIVIKKIEDEGHHDHHGGGWKVAYADFMTAMMAFFLLLWIVAASDEEAKRGLADYFTPSISTAGGKGQGLLDGTVLGEDGVLSGSDGPKSDIQLPSFGQDNPLAVFDSRLREVEPTVVVEYETASEPIDAQGLDPARQSGDQVRNAGEGAAQNAVEAQIEGEDASQAGQAGAMASAAGADGQAEAQAGEDGDLTEAMIAQAQMQTEAERQRYFEELKDEIGMAIRENPDLAALTNNVIFEATPEGLQVQIVDREGRSMFPSGSARVGGQIRDLITIIGRAITEIPNTIVIAGHTDAVPFTDDATYGNWELSADRANASRRILIAAGVSPSRIVEIKGLADTNPLNRDDPHAPENRRISILLQYPEMAGQ